MGGSRFQGAPQASKLQSWDEQVSRHHSRLHAARWSAVRRHVLQRDGWRCRSCGRAGRFEADHITPLERDPGQDPYDPSGLQTLCRSCHIAKTSIENTRHDPAREAWKALVSEISKN